MDTGHSGKFQANETIIRPGMGILVPPNMPCVVTGAYWAEDNRRNFAKLIIKIGHTVLKELKLAYWNRSDWPPDAPTDEERVNFTYPLPMDDLKSDQTREIVCRYGPNGDGFNHTRDEEDRGSYKLYKRYFNVSSRNREAADFKFRIYVGSGIPVYLLQAVPPLETFWTDGN